MTTPAHNPPAGPPAFAAIRTVGRCMPAWLWVVLMWAAMHLPFAAVPEARSEEGRRGMMARAMLEDGNWIDITICGERYIKKPPMLPWLIALSARAVGSLNEWALRLPTLLSMLAAGLAVFAYTRRYLPDRPALFAAAVFYLTPLVVEKARIGETDPIVMACSFGAFAAWHALLDRRPRGIGAWLAAGIILAVGAMAKGPPAIMFFVLGVLVWIVWQRQYSHLPKLLLTAAIALAGPFAWAAAVQAPGDANVWQREMFQRAAFRFGPYLANQARFAAAAAGGCLPWLIMAMPVLLAGWRKRRLHQPGTAPPEPLLLAYVGAATLLLLVFPGAQARYALPAAPALAVAAALRFQQLSTRRSKAIPLIAAVVALGIAARIVVPAVLPYPHHNRSAARQVEQAVSPGETIYKLTPGLMNVAFYINRRVIQLSPEEFQHTAREGVVLLYEGDEEQVARQLKLETVLRVSMDDGRKNRSLLLARTAGLLDEDP